MELYHIIRDYGEEKFAKNIAKAYCKCQTIRKQLETTGELIHVIKAAIPARSPGMVGGHPAKRTFQAIRIEVNRELDVLENSLGDMIDLLNDGGRICVITFHSLEDRHCKEQIPGMRKPMYLPQRISCMRMRKEIKRKSNYTQACDTFTGRTGREQQGKEFETSCIRT